MERKINFIAIGHRSLQNESERWANCNDIDLYKGKKMETFCCF